MTEIQFLGVPDIGGWIFFGLAAAAFVTSFFGVVTGGAGGLLLLALMAFVMPPLVLIPVHTVVQLGAASSRSLIMRRHIMRGMLAPFFAGAVVGAAIGAQIFVTLSTGVLQGILGMFILILTWAPQFAQFGPDRGRFAFLGFGATFLGMFVSATGVLLAPFVASVSPDRRNHVSTLSALMVIVHITKVVAFGVIGVAIGAYLPLIVVMICGAALGNWVGGRTLDHIPEKRFRLVFRCLLSILALRLLWVAASEANII